VKQLDLLPMSGKFGGAALGSECLAAATGNFAQAGRSTRCVVADRLILPSMHGLLQFDIVQPSSV
jgi:hypothetical protein